MTTALVLGAGGLTGQAYHLGVLTALQEPTGFDGRRADVVVGAAMGLNRMRLLRAGRVVRTVAGSVRSRREAQPALVDTLAGG